MPTVATEDLYQLIGFEYVQRTMATGRALQAEQRVAELEAQLQAATAPRARNRKRSARAE